MSGLREGCEVRMRAALLYAASRVVADVEERDALLAEARRLDTLDQVVPD